MIFSSIEDDLPSPDVFQSRKIIMCFQYFYEILLRNGKLNLATAEESENE